MNRSILSKASGRYPLAKFEQRLYADSGALLQINCRKPSINSCLMTASDNSASINLEIPWHASQTASSRST